MDVVPQISQGSSLSMRSLFISYVFKKLFLTTSTFCCCYCCSLVLILISSIYHSLLPYIFTYLYIYCLLSPLKYKLRREVLGAAWSLMYLQCLSLCSVCICWCLVNEKDFFLFFFWAKWCAPVIQALRREIAAPFTEQVMGPFRISKTKHLEAWGDGSGGKVLVTQA